MLPAFTRVQFTTNDSPNAVVRLLLQLQASVGVALDRLLSNPRHDFSVIKGQALVGAASTTVAHKLGRTPLGWSVTDITGNDATVRRISWDATTLVLRASAAVTVNLEVW